MLQRAVVLGIPRWMHMLSSAKGAARTKGRPRARWLAAALSEVCNSRWGIPPPSNCDCSRCEHRSSVCVGVSKALDRFVASLMVDLFSLMSSGDVKAQIRFKSLQNLIWSDHRDIGHLESRDPRERGGCLCACFLTCCLLLTTCSDLDAYAGMCLQLCIITCNMTSCVLKFIKNVYWKCHVIFRLQITIAYVDSNQENNMPQCLACRVVYVPCEISVLAMAK